MPVRHICNRSSTAFPKLWSRDRRARQHTIIQRHGGAVVWLSRCRGSRCSRSARRRSTMLSETGIVHVIDDDEAVRESLIFLLRTAGLEVKGHVSATDFLEVLTTVELGCIISDVRMPGISGIDLLRRLKELNIAVPVIVMTGHGDVPLAVEAMKFGAVDFLEKPFDDEVLLASVQSALRERQGHSKRQTER